jgi:hypothetical protein
MPTAPRLIASSIFAPMPLSHGRSCVADCSPDLLYRTPALRERIKDLRDTAARVQAAPHEELERSSSNVVRELAAQLADEKRQRGEEVAALRAALAAAHGELLELRRGLGPGAAAA